ncbi:hypothetical protein J4Q44_G00273120 [Coregonus suidteri]|uniref:Myomegalin-like n=1 Tax=Coregonus suidteri TaxID=861788 RepID=A0AAN8L1G5_9TELE
MSNGYRTLSQHLNDLKKENFSLKLRIYFLEERIQQKYEDSSDHVYRTNIELKVEVESLKQELQEKQDLLDKALTTAESLSSHNEAELQRRCEERQQEIDHMQELLETKIQLLQEEAQLAQSEAERMASLAGSSSQPLLEDMEDSQEEENLQTQSHHPASHTYRDRVIGELTSALRCKEAMITELSQQKSALTLRVGELEGQVEDLSSSLLQKESDAEFYQEELGRERLRIEQEMQTLIEEQQSQLNQYECAAGQCVSELQKAQLQVQSLQTKIHESEANNAKLQEKLSEMECELRSIRQGAQNQERTIQCLTDSVSTKDNEAEELYQLIEGQNATLCKLREMAHRNQITHTQAPEGGSEGAALAQLQGELVGLQSSLFTLGLELEASQRAQRQSQRQADDLSRAKDRLQSDLKEALQHREVTDKHNQDLSSVLAQSRFELQAKEAQLKESKAEKHTEVQERDRHITQLKHSLQDKERQLQEYSELLESADSSKPRDALLDRLRERIRDRDRALERSIDEKFSGLEEREEQVRKLQLALREKERDLERLRCILSNNEETITNLDALVRSKELDVEQAAEAHRNLQWLQQQGEEREKSTLRERDTLISQLQTALQTRSQETQVLTAALLAKVQAGPNGVVEELKARLTLKEKQFQELLSDRSRQSHEHQSQVQDLLSTISTKDQYIQDCTDRLSLVIGERTGQLQELRRQLSSQEREMGELRRDREKERVEEAERLQNLLKEKEAFIQSLMQGQEESMEPSTPEGAAEVQVIQEELQLVSKKEKEAQLELSALRSALAQAQEQAQKQGDRFKILAPGVVAREPSNTDHQSVLEQLVSEYHRLNDALRAEKRLYQSLSHIQARGNSSEKTQALHTELDSVQALRGQLEEVLARTRKTALALERAAKRQSDFGELSTEEEEEGDDEEGSTDEFSDSIEDDEEKLTAKSLASTKNAGMACEQGVLSGGPVSGALSQGAEGQVKQLAEQKRALEEELEDMRTQLETTGCSSLAQMRSTLLRLQQENEALKENQGGVEGLGELEDPTDMCQGWQQEEEEEMEEEKRYYQQWYPPRASEAPQQYG